MSISFAGISFEKTINTRVNSVVKGESTTSRVYSPLTITVTEHTDKKSGVTSLKSMFKISTEYSEKLNINGLVGDIQEGKSVLVMHPELETLKGKIFCFSEKGKEDKQKSRLFKADALLKNLKNEGLVSSDFGSEKGQKINLGLKDISSEIEGLPEGFFAWKVVASDLPVEKTEDKEVTPTVQETVVTPVSEEVEEEDIKDEDLY